MKFYGTLGDACRDAAVLHHMFHSGMTGMRLNLSHTSLPACRDLLNNLYFPAARAAGVEQPHLIVDLQGPELRVGTLSRPVELAEGSSILLGKGGLPVPPAVITAAFPGCEISLDDSALLLTVREVRNDSLLCRVLRGGVLNSRKSLALLGVEVDSPTLTDEDLANLDAAAAYRVTHVLQPFVRGRADVLTLRSALDERGLGQVQIMAKIENQRGLDHLDEIIIAADQVCIARGDLGNAMPLWQLPAVQKEISQRCAAAGREFCLVTQLLWSMEQRPVPTRAEVADIFNGVLDGAGALMLTGETAVGRYPAQAMDYLIKTARSAQEYQHVRGGGSF